MFGRCVLLSLPGAVATHFQYGVIVVFRHLSHFCRHEEHFLNPPETIVFRPFRISYDARLPRTPWPVDLGGTPAVSLFVMHFVHQKIPMEVAYLSGITVMLLDGSR